MCDSCYGDRYIPCEACFDEMDIQIDELFATESGLTLCETCFNIGYFECRGCAASLEQAEQSPDDPTQCLECLPPEEDD